MHTQNTSRSAVSGDYQVLQNCTLAANIRTAFLASLLPLFLLLPKALNSFGCPVSSRHQPAGKKLISCHIFSPSRSTMVSMLSWKTRDVAARQADQRMRVLEDPLCRELGRNHQKGENACKKTHKLRELQSSTSIKKKKKGGGV